MNEKKLRELINKYKSGKITEDALISKIKFEPFKELGNFAKIDYHREIRTSQPEVIYCEGKTEEHALKIISDVINKKRKLIATRVSESLYRKIKNKYKNLKYNKLAGTITNVKHKSLEKNLVCVITAGTSDIRVAEEASEMLNIFKIEPLRIYDAGVAGLHRILKYKDEISLHKILIVVAGMEGALPGITAGIFGKPIIAVPTSTGYGTGFKGISALLTMLNSCSPGISVVNIDNGFGAGYLAGLICEGAGV